MNLRNRYRTVTVIPGERSGVFWETTRHAEQLLFFRVRTKMEVSCVYVESVALGRWALCSFRLPLESLLAELKGFPRWPYGTQLNLELSSECEHPCTFEIRPVCAGDDVDGLS